MRIYITDLQNIVKLDKGKIKQRAEAILRELGENKTELSLLFVDDGYIKRLNRKYRGVNSSTDVLAFPMREGDGVSKNSPILGDVVVSAETAQRESSRTKRPIQEEIDLYLVHGILHLLGYNDTRPCERKEMMAKALELLGAA